MTPPKNDVERQAEWARGVLECSPDESKSKTLARLLHWTEESDFFPERRWIDAYHTLHPASDEASEDCLTDSYRLHREQELRAVVEQFADEFFSLDVDTRMRRYQELSNDTADFPRATARLKSLVIGLQVEPNIDDIEQADVRELAETVLELFVLSPRPRSARLAERSHFFLQERRAANILKKRHPQIVALMPSLVDRAAKARKKPWEVRGVPVPDVPGDAGESVWSPVTFILLGVTIGIVGLIFEYGNDSIFNSDNDKGKRKNQSTMSNQEQIDEFVDESERMRRLIVDAATKNIKDLTEEERKHYEHMGFFEDDESLQSYKAFNLKFYQLDELRKAWRKVHAHELQRLQEQQVDEEPVSKGGHVEEDDPTLEIVE